MADAGSIARESFEVWNKRDFARLREMYHPDYTYTGGDGQVQKGPQAGLAVAEMFANALPDGRIEIVNIYTAGNVAVTEFIGRGTHDGDLMGIAPTGRKLVQPVCNVMEMKDGKIYREREYMDVMHMMQQLGVVPAPATA